MICAYWERKTCAPESYADSIPARLRHAGPWSVWAGDSGMFYGLRGQDMSCVGDPVETDDGLRFFPPKDPAGLEIEPTGVAAISVRLSSGRVIAVPVAAAAPRSIAFGISGSGSLSDQATDEYAIASELVHDITTQIDRCEVAKERLSLAAEWDGAAIRLAWLAMRRGYGVTEELLNALGWITSEDLETIAIASWGIDPKKLASRVEESDS